MIGYFNEQLFEGADIVSMFAPVDLSTGANAGIWASMRDYHRASIVLVKAAGTANDVSTITLSQAQDNAGTGTKALKIGRRRYKSDMTTVAGDTWTIDDTTTLAETYATKAASGNKLAMIVMDLEAAYLDDANGFHWIQASVDQAAHAALGWCFVALYSSRHSQRVPVSALTVL
jgi:hypothetical protein